MRADTVLRPYIHRFHKRLLFSYQSSYAEARIYTRQFGWKCEFVCKKSRGRELIYSKRRELCKFSDTIFLIILSQTYGKRKKTKRNIIFKSK